MEKRIKVVVVRPKEYPETTLIDDVETWFDGKYVRIPAYTADTIIVAPEQVDGLILNRGLFDDGQTQMR